MAIRRIYKKNGLLLIALSQFLASSINWAAMAKPISYFEAVRLSLSNNPRIGATQASIESAKAAMIETRGTGLPKLALEMNAARSDNPLNVFSYKLSQGNVAFSDFGLGQYTGPNSINLKPRALNAPGYYSNYNAAFKLVVPIYLGGKTKATLKNSNALLNAALHGDQAARMQLAYDILQAYEGFLAAEKLILVAQENIKDAILYHNITKSLFNQSLVIESDVLLADTYLRTTQTILLAAKAESQNHLDEFRTLIGRSDSTYTPRNSVNFPPLKRTIQALTQELLTHNAQLRAIKSTIAAGHAHIDAINAENKPQINLQLRQDWNGNANGAQYASNLIALGLNWGIFSSGERYGASKKAIAEVKQASFQFEETANIMRLALIQAKRAEQLANIELQTNLANAKQAKTVVLQLVKRYGRGLVPLGQLIESQIKLTEAKNHSIQSEYNQVLARGRLLLLTNKLIPFIDK